MREPQNRGLVNWVTCLRAPCLPCRHRQVSVAGLKFLYDVYALARGWVDFGSRTIFIVYAALLPVALIVLYPRREERPR